MKHSGVLPTKQFAYRKGLGTSDTLSECPLHCKVHCRVCRRLGPYRTISVPNFIGLTIRAFSINSVDIGGFVLSILTQFLSNRSHHVVVDGCTINQAGYSCVRSVAGKCFGQVIFSPVHFWSFFPFWKISSSVMLMILLGWLLCRPQSLELQ